MVNKEIIERIIFKAFYEKCGDNYIMPYERADNTDLSNFQEEDYTNAELPYDASKKLYDVSPTGKLQQKQIDAQSEVDYTQDDKVILQGWEFVWYNLINNYLYNNEEFNEFLEKENIEWKMLDLDLMNNIIVESQEGYVELNGLGDLCDRLSEVIDKSPRLLQDTVLYRYGIFPDDLEVGKSGKFKGFSSTSYNKEVGTQQNVRSMGTDGAGAMTDEELRERVNRKVDVTEHGIKYEIKIYAPKGTRGVVLDNENLGCSNTASEFLLDKNQKYVVLSKDDSHEPPTVEILLYDDD